MREARITYHLDVLPGKPRGRHLPGLPGPGERPVRRKLELRALLGARSTPLYLQGARAQIFINETLKIEPWLMNGWQSYGRPNPLPAIGLAVRYSPSEAVTLLANLYWAPTPQTSPIASASTTTTASYGATSTTQEAAASPGWPSASTTTPASKPAAAAKPHRRAPLGTALAQRIWWYDDLFAATIRIEDLTNPSRYLAQTAPTALATAPGNDLLLAGATVSLSFMPRDFFELRLEAVYREASQPSFSGHAGVSPTPLGAPAQAR